MNVFIIMGMMHTLSTPSKCASLSSIIMNTFMFFMFSRISRLDLPCITVRSRLSEDRHQFDRQEAVKVGIIFLLMVNTVIYFACLIALRTAEVAVVLLISMIVVPLAMSTIGIYIAGWIIDR